MSAAEVRTFDLRELAIDVMAVSDHTEYADLAIDVADVIPVEHYRVALELSLPAYLRTLNMSAKNNLRRTDDTSAEKGKRWTSASQIYMSFMRTLVGVPGSGQRRREDVTLDEQRAIAAFRKQQAADTLKEAQREFMFVRAMETTKVQRLGDLPELAVIEILRWEPEQ